MGRFNKILSANVDIDNVKMLYGDNINQALLTILRKRFNRRCYKQCYIYNINKIIKHSAIVVDELSLTGMMKSFITFEADVDVINEFDVIPNCVVKVTKDSGEILGKIDEHINVFIPASEVNQFIRPEQVIPIVVYAVDMRIFSKTFNIGAKMLTPPITYEKETFFEVKKLTDSELAELKPLVDLAIKINSKYLEIKDKAESYNKLLFPTIKNDFKDIDLFKLNFDDGIIIQPPWIDRSLPIFKWTEKRKRVDTDVLGTINNPIKEHSRMIISVFLNRFIAYNNLLISMVNQYDSVRDEYENLWNSWKI